MVALNKRKKLTKDRKRVGRGGDLGGTSGRGHKGQKSRSGPKIKASFEGGQMPLSRRLPKRGFNNSRFKQEVVVVNLRDLETRFAEGDVVDRATLFKHGIIKGNGKFLVKILGNGSLSKKLTVFADQYSKSAIDAITKVGGQIGKIEESHSDSPAA